MSGECHFCHGLVLAGEPDHIVLDDHADHNMYVHRRCAEGHDLVMELRGSTSEAEITCPGCGTACRLSDGFSI